MSTAVVVGSFVVVGAVPASAAGTCGDPVVVDGLTTVTCTVGTGSVVVPDEVGQATVTLDGAGGAPAVDGTPGGKGARVVATIAVTSGQTLNARVGNRGVTNTGSRGGQGAGGDLVAVTTATGAPLLTAGSGGGAAGPGYGSPAYPGTPGANSGSAGTNGAGGDGLTGGGQGGGAGTATSGGAGGAPAPGYQTPPPGNSGGFPNGPRARASSPSYVPAGFGGGGGGGYGAGGAGGQGGSNGGSTGGAGGSGGGGSSYVSGLVAGTTPTVTDGVNAGDGRIVFVFAPLPPRADTITATSGGGQSTPAGLPFAAPLTVTVNDQYGAAFANAEVTFTATGGATFAGSATATATTDPAGVATSPALTAGPTPGPVTVTATTPGVTGTADYALIVTAPIPAAITARSGSGQSAETTATFGAPLVAAVTDTAGGASSGTPVTFTITSGPASFAGGQSTANATTDATGSATAPALVAGNTPGQVTITAATPGVASTATFTATVTDPPGPVRADLSATITAPTAVPKGVPFEVTLRAHNDGPHAAADVRSTLTLPLDWCLVDNGGGTTGGLLGNQVTFTTGSIPRGATADYTITVVARPFLPGPRLLTGHTVSLRTWDTNYLNNTTASAVTITHH
ncbi:hypothetical protein JOD54_004495 [Actinokineospora baliensis]|uniref:DUF11 domain-containing protein n=1 Tax=Actinokineospora baliensis TaxID=547056 RepID=UPI00195D7BEA|nr:DUF11 domain-containing protein [Actinokineospora baliensis]MBM7774291.1 hypothetical protein [Actinokineospora baliensis]